jgi:hypothetical protein
MRLQEQSRSTGQRGSDRRQDAGWMPAASRDAPLYLGLEGRWIGRDAALVPGGVAVPAGSDDVGRAVAAAVAAGDKVLGGAPERAGLSGGQAVSAAERFGVVQPNGQAAVVAAPVLTVEGELA